MLIDIDMQSIRLDPSCIIPIKQVLSLVQPYVSEHVIQATALIGKTWLAMRAKGIEPLATRVKTTWVPLCVSLPEPRVHTTVQHDCHVVSAPRIPQMPTVRGLYGG